MSNYSYLEYGYIRDPVTNAYVDFYIGNMDYDHVGLLLAAMNIVTLDLKTDYALPGGHLFKAGYAFDLGFFPSPVALFETFGKKYTWAGYNIKNSLGFTYQRTLNVTDQFSLAFGVDADMGLWTYKAKLDIESKPASPLDNDQPHGPEVLEFTVIPKVKIGGTYAFAEKPFQLNLGLELAPRADPTAVRIAQNTEDPLYSLSKYKPVYDGSTEYLVHQLNPLGLNAGLGLGFSPNSHIAFDLLLSQNLTYYVSDKLEWVFSWDLRDWTDHPFSAAAQITFTF
jgi:hypothetical protein